MNTPKRIIYGLVGLFALGFFGYSLVKCAQKNQHPASSFVPSSYAPNEKMRAQRSPLSQKPLASKRINLSRVAHAPQPRSSPSRASDSSNVYSASFQSIDSFPVDESDTIDDLVKLFSSDCSGRCLYLRDSGEDTLTKIMLRPGEKIELYDPTFETCFAFQGDNIWVYAHDDGAIQAWGNALGRTHDAADIFYSCEEGKTQ